METTTDVDALLSDHPDPVAGLARRLRAVLLDGRSDLVEHVRTGWHSLNYHDPAAGFVCALFPLTDRVQLVFERGTLLPDPHGLLTGTGSRVRALEFPTGSVVDPEVVLEFLDHAVDVGARLRGLRG
jgi:hypothetical protein